MQVAYNHLPRKLSFYLRFIVVILTICIPIVIVLPIWYSHVAMPWLIGLILITIAFRISSVFKPVFQLLVVDEDHGIPKEMDISQLEMDVPDTLEDIKLLLELEGFERFGEIEEYTVGSDKPIPYWTFSKANGKLLAAATVVKGNIFMAFMTYAEDGLVMTYYPSGHRLKLDKAQFSGVSSSIEDAYKYHLKQLQRTRPRIGRIIPVKSIKQYLYLDRKFSPLSKKHQRLLVRDGIIAQTTLSIGFALAHGLFASWWFPQQYTGLFVGWRLPAAAIVFIVSLVFGIIVENRKNGIKNINKA